MPSSWIRTHWRLLVGILCVVGGLIGFVTYSYIQVLIEVGRLADSFRQQTADEGPNTYTYEGSDRDRLVLFLKNTDKKGGTVKQVWIYHRPDEGPGYSFVLDPTSGSPTRKIPPNLSLMMSYKLVGDDAKDRNVFNFKQTSECKLGAKIETSEGEDQVSFLRLPCQEIWPMIDDYSRRRSFVSRD